MIQDMINSETIWIQLNRQTQTYSRRCILLGKFARFEPKNANIQMGTKSTVLLITI